MKTTKLFFMAALALMTAACSNDDNDFENPAQQPAEAQGIPFTATISMGGDKATTRALSENSSGLTATWTVDEEVALIHNGIIDKVTVASVSGNDATISGTITTDADGAAVTVIFPYSAVDLDTKDVKADLLYAQSGGTLADVAAKYDVRKGTGTLKVSGTASLNDDVTLTNQFAIFKFTLQDLSAAAKNATEFKVSNGSGNVMTTVTPTSASGELYVALPVMAIGTYWFNATIDSKPYIAKATTAATTVAGKYYQTTVKMATIGDVILDNGKFAAPSSTGTKVAMIAYLGNGSDCTNGLAIQLNASPASVDNWSAACSYSSYPSITGNPGTWRLPSKDDWQNMFVGCAKEGDATSPDGDGKMNPIAGFKEKIDATGITWLSVNYWSSTGSGSNAWYLNVSVNKMGAIARFYEGDTSKSCRVLGCLAF